MKRVSITFFALTAFILVCLSSQANPAYQTPRYEAPTYQTPRYQTPRVEAPAFTTPTFSTPISMTQTVQAPRVQTPPLIGPRFQAAYWSTSVVGTNFSDVYVADPDDRFDAKSVAELAQEDMARFGLAKPVESPLEASLFPRKTETAVAYQPPLPVNLYSLDSRLAYVQ